MTSERPEKKRKLMDEKLLEEKDGDKGQAIGPGFFSAGKLKSADIKKFVIECLRNDQYEHLVGGLAEQGFLEEEKVEKFFLKEGDGFYLTPFVPRAIDP